MKPNRKHKIQAKLGEEPEEVKQARMLLKLGIGGSRHWEIISNAIQKYPQWFK